jgi:hypothetical protein
LFLLGLLKIPIIGFVRPKLLHIDDSSIKVLIRQRRRTNNHLGSMYLGELTVGADIAGALHLFYYSLLFDQKNVSIAFKEFRGVFLLRAEGDITFECSDGLKMKAALEESRRTGDRMNQLVEIQALNSERQVVAQFEMVVSVKCKP